MYVLFMYVCMYICMFAALENGSLIDVRCVTHAWFTSRVNASR